MYGRKNESKGQTDLKSEIVFHINLISSIASALFTNLYEIQINQSSISALTLNNSKQISGNYQDVQNCKKQVS